MRPKEEFWEEGIELFNRGMLFECHEAWEEIWKRSAGKEKKFLQGMIQAAVALLHAQRGNLEGARSLHLKARQKLDGLEPAYRGIALEDFRREVASFIDAAVRNGNPAEGSLPRIKRAEQPRPN